jgi:hypothetical protein
MPRQVVVPGNWAARIPGNPGDNQPVVINFPNASTHSEAAEQVSKAFGIPFAAVQGFAGSSELSPGGTTLQAITTGIEFTRAQTQAGRRGQKSVPLVPAIGTGGEESSRSATGATTEFEQVPGGFTFSPGTFATPAIGDETGAGGEGGASIANGLVRPEDVNPENAWQLGKSAGGYAVYGRSSTGKVTTEPVAAYINENGLLDVGALLAGIDPNAAVWTDSAGDKHINPWVQQLLALASNQNGFISEQQIAQVEAQGAADVARIEAEAQLNIAVQQGADAAAVEQLRLSAEKYVANKQAEANEFAAQAQAGAASPFGFLQQGGTTEQLEEIYDQLNEVGLAQAGAQNVGAQDNIFSFAAANPNISLNQIAQLSANTPEAIAARAQQESTRLRAEADREIARIQSNVSLDANDKQLAIANVQATLERELEPNRLFNKLQGYQIQAEAQRDVAQTQSNPFGLSNLDYIALQQSLARGGLTPFQRLAEANVQFNPFGQTAADIQRLQETQYNPFGFSTQQGFDIAAANAANNPFAATQLGQDANRIDQILRGGLSAEQQRQLALANQAGQMQGNLLNFLGDPYAVGAAQTLTGGNIPGFSTQQLQQIADAPSGTLPAFAAGLNDSPFALPETQAIGGARGLEANFTQGQFQDLSPTEQRSVTGQLSGYGITPDEIEEASGSFTPGTTQYLSSYA